MRKRLGMGLMLALLSAALLFGVYLQKQNSVSLNDGTAGVPYLEVSTWQSVNRVSLWQDEEDGKSWFFLPSCVDHHKVRVGNLEGGSLWVDNALYEEGDTFVWEEDREYRLEMDNADGSVRAYQVSFLKSAHIPSVFISTQSGELEYLHADKANWEPGKISVVRADGGTEYQGSLPRISGRGNSTWEYEKKPYSIKLPADYPLCGLDKGDTFRLLALWREGSKLDNKIAMDLAEALGLSYSVQGTWVDLYMNGEYRGIYLLTESVSVGKGRVDIHDLEAQNRRDNTDIDNALPYAEEDSKGYLLEHGAVVDGGYLIEKDHPKHWEVEPNGFATSRGDLFTINAPGHASREQVAYIQDYVEHIDALVQDKDPAVWDYLDLDSFVKRFLVDEIALETDTGLTSMYFYKDQGDDKLYSGPAWDYDNAFGERNSGEGVYVNYTESIVNNNERKGSVINWYQMLYETPEMYERVAKEYAEILPFFERLLSTGIDEYKAQIDASVKMDRVLWADKNIKGDSSGKYAGYDANVRYTKYFIAKRLNYLCERWGVPHEAFAVPVTGETHQITFSVYEGVVGVMEVPDGAELQELPGYDESVYQGWVYEYSGENPSPYIPVYEDMGYYNAKW